MSRTSIRKLIRNMPVGVIYLTDQLALKNSFILTNTSKPKDSPPTLWDLSAGYGTAPVEQRVMGLAQGPNLNGWVLNGLSRATGVCR